MAMFVRLLALGLGLFVATQIAAVTRRPAEAPLTSTPTPEASSITISQRPSTELSLAAALVDALNGGDEDGVVGLFDPEATLHMDRYAWAQYEIHLWARAQIAASIVVEPEGAFQATPNRAMWTARVARSDWQQHGVQSVRMASRILTEGDRIMDFSADPLDGSTVTGLGDLWRPGSAPEPTLRSAARVADTVERAAEVNPATAAISILGGAVATLLVFCATRQRTAVYDASGDAGLIVSLRAWRRGRKDGR